MKLINYTLLYTSIALLVIVGVWAGIFYVNMLDEIYDSIDDGLSNSKLLIIQRAKEDSSVLYKNQFGESNYLLQPLSASEAMSTRDLYKDTLMYMHNEQDYEPVRLLTTSFSIDKNRFYQLKIISSMVEEDDLMEDLFYSVLWLYIILVVSVLAVNMVVFRKIWKPFYRLIEYLQQYKLGKGDTVLLQSTSVSEFKLLTETISGLLERNLAVYNSQKQFIENAAHELQTPLAASINKLELMAEKNEGSEEQIETISQVVQLLERMTRLNKSLLLLSKIENKQFASEEIVCLNSVIKKVIEDYRDLTEFKNIQIVYSEGDPLNRSMNRDLAIMLVSNLIKNAIVHNINGGLIEIAVQKDSFSISNTGESKALNAEKLFSRFYKESTEKSSTGLGLSISKAILDLYKGHIVYTFLDRHTMTIIFN